MGGGGGEDVRIRCEPILLQAAYDDRIITGVIIRRLITQDDRRRKNRGIVAQHLQSGGGIRIRFQVGTNVVNAV